MAKKSVSEQVDNELARAAINKRQRGETPTQRELAALRRVEAAAEEKRRWEYYATIPQKHWREMSGRQTKILKEQASRYGIPFADKEIDLPAVVLALHDFLATNKTKLARDDDGEAESEALERLREEQYRLKRLDRLEREGELIPRDRVHDYFGRVSSILRSVGDKLQRLAHDGDDAFEIFDTGLAAAIAEIHELTEHDQNGRPIS